MGTPPNANARRRQRTDGQALFPAIAANRRPVCRSSPRLVRFRPSRGASARAQATTRRDFTVHAPLPAFPLAMIRYSGAMPLHAPRRLRLGAIRGGDVPEACAVLCRSSCRQRAQGMAPLYGFMHGHELAIDGTRIDTGLHALQGKRSCKRISRGFIKKKWYTATTRQWQRRPWRQRTTAYKITHTPTVVLYMQISKRI